MQPSLHHQQDILLAIFSSMGILGLLVRCIYLVVTGILSYDPVNMENLASSLLTALGMLFCAVLLLPMLILSNNAIKGRYIRSSFIHPIKLWQVAVLVLIWIICVLLGSVISSDFNFGWALSAPFFLSGIALPILTLVWIATGGIPSGSIRRSWSVYGISMVGSTVFSVLIEYFVIGVAVLILGIAAAANPGLFNLVNQVKSQIRNANAGDIQSLVTTLAPYLTNPAIILSILVFAAVLTPLIEEALKPAVLWLLGNHLHSPAEGFVLGAMCGAGFATMEGLLAASGATQVWGFGQAGRAAASLMHITASGILGWGIASFQLKKHPGRLLLAYLLAGSIHGLWNASAVLAIYGSLRSAILDKPVDLLGGFFIIIGMVFLFLIIIILATALPVINHYLRPSTPSSLSISPPPPMDVPEGDLSLVRSDIIAPPTH